MTPLKVWAPKAAQVQVQVNQNRMPMQSLPNGWWTIKDPAIQHGVDYFFIVDDSKPLPDPRSPWQPEGVHGPSRVLDHSLFNWEDAGWQQAPLSAAVIYELHVGTFTKEGTFDGVIQKLDYLRDLGITHIELMPVNGFSGSRGWGYDGVNLFAPFEPYGGPEGLKRLVNTCHKKGLAVIMDVVYNHLGPEGNYLEPFAPYFTQKYGSPWGKAVNLDGAGSHETRRFFIDNALMWLRDYHIDALRIDAVHAFVDMSAVHFMEQISNEVEALQTELGRHLYLIAESDLNNPRVVWSKEIGGYGHHAQWSDDFHHALHSILTGERDGYYNDFGQIADLAKALKSVFVNDGRFSPFRQRYHGRPVTNLSGNCFLGYIQDHDQIGNRAKGERISHLVNTGRVKIAAALVFFAPFVPMIFQGEEWAASAPFQYFTDHQDPGLGEAVKEGRRAEFQSFAWDLEDIPDPQAEETFERSKLNWEERTSEPHDTIFAWYQHLILLRKQHSLLQNGNLRQVCVELSEKEQWLRLHRESLTLVCNFSSESREILLKNATKYGMLLSSAEGIQCGEHSIGLPGESVCILRNPAWQEERQTTNE